MRVTVENLFKEFGITPALHGVSLESGRRAYRAARAVRLRQDHLAAADRRPRFSQSGRILFGDEDASAEIRSGAQRRLRVPELCAVPSHDVFENIAFGLRVRPATRPDENDDSRAGDDAARSGSALRLDKRFPNQLSGGQRQRVAFARALAIEPRLLLLDEPFGALDAKVRRELRRWLREIHDRTGHTTVFVTHDQEEALELADRVAVLNKGKIEQVGSPDDIYDRPASPFVFDFIGNSSMLPVAIENGKVRFDDNVLALDATGVAEGRRRCSSGPTTSGSPAAPRVR